MAMYLVTLDPSDLSKTYIIAPQTLYLEFRISFTRVQTTLTASTRLIQAGLLLAAYEYASGRPHAAYVSIGTCVRMASILGIDTYDRAPGGSSNGTTSTLKSLEIQNIYWAMIMLERLVLDECPLDNLSPALNFPDSETELPSDLVSSHHMDSPSNKIQSDQTASIGDIHASNVGSFGRQIQAISFLIQVLHNTEKGASTPLSDLIKLDEKLRGFLTVLMNQSSQRHTCGANGIVIRSLVRLHQYILKRSSVPDLAEAKIQEQSHATLDTLARMMVEVAYDHLERFVPDKIDSLPLSCSYNMRSMMELIEDRWCHLSTEDPPRGLEAFVALHDVVCKRWRPPLVPQTL
ncbi:hypothetical protein N7456_001689 [Penicillium angulare]|uniref:Transcription factor domain-containing protein n=1 Tax=Penicillium angulare TaxID=116970 RepID=A0A9W9G6V0_9EURO|nr:hypothetical protein N7456_001689 [Penicillium angulare]